MDLQFAVIVGQAVAPWFIFVTLVIAIRQSIVTRKDVASQLAEAKRSTDAEIAMEVFRELRDQSMVDSLRKVYNLKADDLKKKKFYETPDGELVDYVLDRFDTLGSLVRKQVIDYELAIEAYGGPALLRCWYKLSRSYIKPQQDKRGYFAQNYEGLARLCLDYFEEKNIEIRFFQKGKEDKDLVKVELKKPGMTPRTFKDIGMTV